MELREDDVEPAFERDLERVIDRDIERARVPLAERVRVSDVLAEAGARERERVGVAAGDVEGGVCVGDGVAAGASEGDGGEEHTGKGGAQSGSDAAQQGYTQWESTQEPPAETQP